MSSPMTPSFPPKFSTACRKNTILRALLAGVLIFLATQVYLYTTTTIPITTTTTEDDDRISDWETEFIDENLVKFYSNTFQDLISDNFLTKKSKILTVGTQIRYYTDALQQSGVVNSKVITRNVWVHFKNDMFDVEFIAHKGLDRLLNLGEFALELSRVLKQDGYLIIHTESQDSYSLNSLLDLFDSFNLIRVKQIVASHWETPLIREVVLKKEKRFFRRQRSCSIPGYKRGLIRKLEPLNAELSRETSIEIKENFKNFKYLPSMVDISFKTRYIYIDVGARNYKSSIGSWFKKKYPKQNKDFKIFAIEENTRFHKEYESKKKITLLPYEAWVKNESLSFEENPQPFNKSKEKEEVIVQGFDFASWVKSTFSERDFVVMKMDVEGREYELIKKMIENGAICLIDEMFVECHYSEEECFDLFRSLRHKGVLVHQWWQMPNGK